MSHLENHNGTVGFTKMSGHGNTFIVVDTMNGTAENDWADCAVRWCDPDESIGADGLLVLEQSDRADVRMRIFNSDGSEAEMCGNGARCAAWLAFERGRAPSHMTLETIAGLVGASVIDAAVSVKLTDTPMPGEPLSVRVDGRDSRIYAINSGVPHAVTFKDCVGEMSAGEVMKLGHSIRFHPAFMPAGTNVDFVEVVAPQVIRVRTYERGVESETKACGTGAVASAIISHCAANVGDPPIAVQMPGGVLFVDFEEHGSQMKNIWLSGEVKSICSGVLLTSETVKI
ncbi:MAG: diaminopimelate epimerase [Deltaproteobacteria bacterium]|nr:diaminopimelate epimerase [Deltaproteobacteria bacterium]